MKKLLTLMLASAMLTTTGITAFATTIDQTVTPPQSNTDVTINAAPCFVVTIPTTIQLSGNYGELYTSTAEISAENVFLEEGKHLLVTVSSKTSYNMWAAGSTTYQLPYTISTEAFGSSDHTNPVTNVAQFDTSVSTQTVTMTIATDETPQYAGNFTDVVTFGISVES